MKWFDGSIPDAIQKSKTDRTLLVIHITGDNELSKQTEAMWDDEKISNISEQNGCVALKIDAASEAYTQLSAFYPAVFIPMTYFIREDGTPLDVSGGEADPRKFQEVFEKVLQVHESQKRDVPLEGATSQPPENTLSPEEKAQRMRQLLDETRIKKEQQKEQREKEEEIMRRKAGQEIKDLQKSKAEKEMEELKNSRRKEKEEERKARERVKEQIAKDREERAAKFQKQKSEQDGARQKVVEAKLLAEKDEVERKERVKSETARIQFRLPDASVVNSNFQSSQTLSDARNFIAEHLRGKVTEFSLQTIYPKRVYTEEDMSKTFTELQLVPNAALIVLPGRRKPLKPKPGGSDSNILMSILWLIPSFFMYLWGMISGLFGGQSSGPAEAATQPAQDESETSSSAPRRDRPQTAYKRRTPHTDRHVGRLSDPRDDDNDDNATWNGNSTQQL